MVTINNPYVIFAAAFFLIIILIMISSSLLTLPSSPRARGELKEKLVEPIIKDSRFAAVPVFRGLGFPSTMAFLGEDDILVLEKDKGTVQRITDGKISDVPLFRVENISHIEEQGMLGIAISNKSTSTKNVFLYFTEPTPESLDDTANRLYKFELNTSSSNSNDNSSSSLTNPRLLLSIPDVTDKPLHNGGALLIGSDGFIYLPIGDMGYDNTSSGLPHSGGIIRITQDGQPAGVFANDMNNGSNSNSNSNLFYATGIRNSFGIDFDPITGNLWDTENGPIFGDEVNLVTPGFNSGWGHIQGIWEVDKDYNGQGRNLTGLLPALEAIRNYSSPELTWNHPIGVSAIKFFDSDRYGEKYRNGLFVGDVINGRLYHFDLIENRTSLLLNGSLSDKVVDYDLEVQDSPYLFGEGFGGITDMEIGPDGYLYILSLGNDYYSPFNDIRDYKHYNDGTIYKIIPLSEDNYKNPSSSLLQMLETKSDNKTILGMDKISTDPKEGISLDGNETLWYDTDVSNLSYIESTFKVWNTSNPKDQNTGVIWKDGEDEYYVYLRSKGPGGTIHLYSSNREGFSSTSSTTNTFAPNYLGEWNSVKILYASGNINIFYNGLLRIQMPLNKDSEGISKVGVRSFNSFAEVKSLAVS